MIFGVDISMEDKDLSAIIELAKLKNDNPEEYARVRSSIKEVAKDMVRLGIEIAEEFEAENKEKKKQAKDDLDLKIAEKMKRDGPRK
jgi:hypothetical protein